MALLLTPSTPLSFTLRPLPGSLCVFVCHCVSYTIAGHVKNFPPSARPSASQTQIAHPVERRRRPNGVYVLMPVPGVLTPMPARLLTHTTRLRQEQSGTEIKARLQMGMWSRRSSETELSDFCREY